MFCVKCGARNDDGRQFCENCGAPLTPSGAGQPGTSGQSPSGYGGPQPNYGAAPGAGQPGTPGQSPSGYGYGGQQPGYGAAPGAGQPGTPGQSPSGYGYGGPQPNYGAAPGAGQPGTPGQGPAGYGYGGQQPGYGSAPVATRNKNMLPIIIAIAAVAVIAIVVVVFVLNRGGGDLVGTWSYEQDGMTFLMTFKKDGSGTMEAKEFGGLSLSFVWEDLSDDEIEMTLLGQTVVMRYSIKGDTLTLTEKGSGEVQRMTREK